MMPTMPQIWLPMRVAKRPKKAGARKLAARPVVNEPVDLHLPGLLLPGVLDRSGPLTGLVQRRHTG